MAGEQRYPALLLRPWEEADAGALRAAIDEDVDHLRPWLSWTLEEPATLEQTRLRLRGWVAQYRLGEAFRYAITPQDRPSLILGGAGLNTRVGPSAHDISYWVRRSAVRQGIAAAAVSRLAIHAFTRRRVNRLVIQCDVANATSASVARALGFRFTGAVAAKYPDGRRRPVLQYEMTRARCYLRYALELRARARRIRLAGEAPAVRGS